MSLSREPITSTLQNGFACGVKDITGEPYAGRSGIHNTYGNAVHTSNGAGPHNIQLFVLAPDGTVLHCLPGYWNAEDLAYELRFAKELGAVWSDRSLSRTQKDDAFRKMHLAHVTEHNYAMVRRSRMQGFDQEYEAKNRLNQSDTIKNPRAITAAYEAGENHAPESAFKTTDQIMHERMAKRPFVPYDRFDVAAFSDYGRPFYDKNEDERDAHTEKLRDRGRMHGERQRDRRERGRRSDSGVRNYNW